MPRQRGSTLNLQKSMPSKSGSIGNFGSRSLLSESTVEVEGVPARLDALLCSIHSYPWPARAPSRRV